MDLLTTLWFIPLVAVVIIFAVLIGIRRTAFGSSASSERRYWQLVLLVGAIVAALRVGICWFLTYRAFLHRESLSEVPLIGLLMPEYLLAPGDPAAPAGMWALTGALVIGSFAGVSVLAALVWRFFGRATRRTA